MMKNELEELIEEHKENLDILDDISQQSFKSLYVSLLKNLIWIVDEVSE